MVQRRRTVIPGRKDHVRPVTDEALLEKVQELVPSGDWPKGLHKLIADQLSISHNLGVRALGTLLSSGASSTNHTNPSACRMHYPQDRWVI